MSEAIMERYNRQRLVSANARIREHFAAGIPAERIAETAFPEQPPELALDALAAMSLAETHELSVGEAAAVLPSLLENAYGENFKIADVISDLYTKSEPFSIPTQPTEPEEITARVAEEEAGISEFQRQQNQFMSNMNDNIFGAFGQSLIIHRGIVEQQNEFAWFSKDPDKQAFYESMINAETEDQREEARQSRFNTLMGREIDRLTQVATWQRRIQATKENPPGVWTSKLNAWSVGVGRIAVTGMDTTSDLMKLGGLVGKSPDLLDMSDNLADWSRAYHKATQEPELSFQGVNVLDDMVNSLLTNIPYTGAMIAAAVLSPDKVTPFVIFAGGAAMGSSEIKQTALDNGISEEVANMRGWIGGGVIGLIEAASGGASKYNPKKLFSRIATFPGKLTKNALKEIFREEIPQEIIEMVFAEDTPRKANGDIDWDATTNRMLIVSRDTAFMSAFFTSSSSVVSGMMEKSANQAINKDTAQVTQDAFDIIAEESRTGVPLETRTAEQIVAEEAAAQEVTATLETLQAEAVVKRKLADGTPLEAAERTQFPEIAQQEDQISKLREPVAQPPTAKPVNKAQQRNLDALAAHPEADVVEGTTRVRMTSPNGVVSQVPAGQIEQKLADGFTLNTKEQALAQAQQEADEAAEEAEARITPKKDVEAPEPLPDASNEIDIESVPRAEDIDQMVKETPRFGVNLQPDGKFTVTDWITQEEVKSNLNKKEAIRQANELNAGRVELPVKRIRDILPSSADMQDMTFIDMLNNIGIDLSLSTRKAISATKNAMVKLHTDLGEYAKRRLQNLDITNGQRDALIKKISEAKTPATQLRAIELVETMRELSRQRKGRARFNKIRALVNKRGTKKMRDGGIHFSTYDTLSNLIKQYTTLKGKTLNAIKRAATHLDNIRDNLGDSVGATWAASLMPKTLTDKFSQIMATPLTELSADELSDLNDTLQRYLKQSQLWNTLLTNRHVRQMKDFLNNATANIKIKPNQKALAGNKLQRGFFKSIGDHLFGIKNADVHTIAVKIWGRFTPIKRMMDDARRTQLMKTLQYVTQVRAIVQESGIDIATLKDWSPFMHEVGGEFATTVKDVLGKGPTLYDIEIGGEKRQFTMAELMAFTMNFRNSYNLRQMVRNGIGTIRQRIGQINQTEAQEMLDVVENNPAALGFVDSLQEWYIQQANDGNETSRELDGRNLFNEDDYFHIEYEREGGVMGTEYVRDSIVEEESRQKLRIGSDRPVAIRDIFQTMQEDINVMSTFVGLAPALRRLRSLANYKPFRKKMTNAGGKFVLGEFDKSLQRYQLTRQPPMESIERAVQKITSGVSRAILINPGIAILQPTSSVLYGTEVSPKYMKTILGTLGTDFRTDIRNNWIMFAAREQGLGASKTIATASDVKRTFTEKGAASDKALSLIHIGDILGVSKAALVVRAEMSDGNMTGTSLAWWQNFGADPSGLKYGTAEYWQAFNVRADYLVSVTQPMFFSENRSSFTGSENVFTRSIFRFRAFTDQVLRIVQRNIIMRNQGDISNAEMSYNIGLALALVSVIGPLMKTAFNALLGRKPEVDMLLRDMVTGPLTLIPVAGFPLKQLTSALLGFEGKAKPHFTAMPIMLIDRILQHSWDVARGLNASLDDEFIQSGPNRNKKKSEVFLKRGLKGLGSDMLLLNGVPIPTIERIEWFDE